MTSVDTSTGEKHISAPLVFQCAKCFKIVGDSYSLICSHEELGTVTLASASNIARSPDVYTSKEGRDVGSTYFSFTCSHCDSRLGNYYLTTSKDLDEIREKFTFSVSTVTAYEIGAALLEFGMYVMFTFTFINLLIPDIFQENLSLEKFQILR